MNEKLSAISQLIELAKVDGNVSEQEIRFLHALGAQMGISEDQMLELFKNPVKFDAFQNEMDNIVQFQRLVLMVNVDQSVDAKEIEMLRWIGLRLGLNIRATDEIIRRMHEFPNGVIPPNELIAIYKKHHN